jgi:DNA modification methylase
MDKYTFSTGENIEYMKALPSESVDFIYFDPPFNTGKEFNVHDGKFSEEVAYTDLWNRTPNSLSEYQALKEDIDQYKGTNYYHDLLELFEGLEKLFSRRDPSMFSYLVNISRRIVQGHRLLKPTGSIALHCDTHACGYLNIVLDILFGRDNQVNHLIWNRSDTNKSSRSAGSVHDHIFIYGKTQDYVWNTKAAYHKKTQKYIDSFNFCDSDGRKYKVADLTGPGKRGGTCGLPWKKYDPNTAFLKPRHWAISMEDLGPEYKLRSGGKDLESETSQEKLEKLESVGLLQETENFIGYKQYYDPNKGIPLVDIWLDIHRLTGNSKEGQGFRLDTQKPIALLERLIDLLTPEGGVVLDPYAGSGTTGIAAYQLGRSFICYERNERVAEQAKDRIRAVTGLVWSFQDFSPVDVEAVKFQINRATALDNAGDKASARDIRQVIQVWAIQKRLGGYSNGKGPDKGIDGYVDFQNFQDSERLECLIEIKTGSTGPKDVTYLHSAIGDRERAVCGLIVHTDPPTREMQLKALSFGTRKSGANGDNTDYPVIQFMLFDDLFQSDPLKGRLPGFVQRLDPEKSPHAIQRRAQEYLKQVNQMKQDNRAVQTNLFEEMLELESE